MATSIRIRQVTKCYVYPSPYCLCAQNRIQWPERRYNDALICCQDRRLGITPNSEDEFINTVYTTCGYGDVLVTNGAAGLNIKTQKST